MKTRHLIGALTVGLSLTLLLGLAPRQASHQNEPSPQNPAAKAAFEIDPVHSSVIFKINHMGVTNFYGRFNDITGTYTLNEENPEQSQFDIQVKAESVDSKNSKRDTHLKSPDFFNVAEYPTISFKSTKVTQKDDLHLAVAGDLTLHGATKPITVDMTVFPAKQSPQGVKGGLETTFTIKRTDFGMDQYVSNGALGDDVTITVALEAARK